MKRLALVILAAGEARRFGSAKQLADCGGRPLLQRVLDNACGLPGLPVYLVLGARADTITAALHTSRARILRNRAWREGMATSIHTAINALQNEYDAIMLLAGDQPRVDSADLARLIAHWRRQPGQPCAAYYDDNPGIPAIFPRSLFPQLLALQGDRGARRLLRQSAQTEANAVTRVLGMPSAALDIDRPSDLVQLDRD